MCIRDSLAAELLIDFAHDLQVRIGAVVGAVGIVFSHTGVVAHCRVVGVRIVGLVPLEGEQHALGPERLLHPCLLYTSRCV